jgi:hypothetical protein
MTNAGASGKMVGRATCRCCILPQALDGAGQESSASYALWRKMFSPGTAISPWRRPFLTPLRIGLAFAVAIAADGIQALLGPFGWTFFDEITDVVTAVAATLLLGFHPLLLPTFLLEVFPVADMLPAWTACVAAVVALRRRAQRAAAPDAAVPSH